MAVAEAASTEADILSWGATATRRELGGRWNVWTEAQAEEAWGAWRARHRHERTRRATAAAGLTADWEMPWKDGSIANATAAAA